MKERKFRNLMIKTKSIGFDLLQAGEEICKKGDSFGPAVRQNFIFHYIIAGEGTYYYNDEKHKVKCGEGFMIFPEDATTYKASGANPWHYMWIEFNSINAISCLKEIGITKENPIYRPKTYDNNSKLIEMPQEEKYLKKLIREVNSEYSIMGFVYLLIDALAQNNLYKPEKTHEEESFSYVKQATEYIERRYHTEITVEDIADYCSINRSYLGKLFQEHLGISTQRYLFNYRMKIAKELLKDKRLPIKTVATSVGYGNQLHFSQVFKKKFGKSPKIYREQHL